MKVDVTPIAVALIIAVASVIVARTLADRPKYVPVGVGGLNDRAFYLNTETGRCAFGI